MFGGDKAKTRKVNTLHNDIAALEAALVSAKAEYERVKGRNEEVSMPKHLLCSFIDTLKMQSLLVICLM